MSKFTYIKNKRVRKGDYFDKIKIGKNIYMFRFYSKKKLMEASSRIIMFDDLKNPNLIGESFQKLNKIYSEELFDFGIWDCFSIDKKDLKTFLDGSWNPLRKAEKQVIDALKKVTGNYSVIMITQATDPSTINHEIAHSLWSTNKIYKERVLKELKKVDLKPVFKILKHFYKEESFLDESQAYLAHNLGYLKKQGLNCKNYLEVSSRLRLIFEDYIF